MIRATFVDTHLGGRRWTRPDEASVRAMFMEGPQQLSALLTLRLHALSHGTANCSVQLPLLASVFFILSQFSDLEEQSSWLRRNIVTRHSDLGMMWILEGSRRGCVTFLFWSVGVEIGSMMDCSSIFFSMKIKQY